MWRLEVGPALHDFPAGNPPDHNSAKLQPLPTLYIRRCPVVPHHHFVILFNHVLNLHMQIGKSLQRPAHILNRPRRSRRHSKRHINLMIVSIQLLSVIRLRNPFQRLSKHFMPESIGLGKLFPEYMVNRWSRKVKNVYKCPVEVTLDVSGGKWKNLILWHLRSDTKRFAGLKRLMPGSTISTLIM